MTKEVFIIFTISFFRMNYISSMWKACFFICFLFTYCYCMRSFYCFKCNFFLKHFAEVNVLQMSLKLFLTIFLFNAINDRFCHYFILIVIFILIMIFLNHYLILTSFSLIFFHWISSLSYCIFLL
jgi:hypothetical protein